MAILDTDALDHASEVIAKALPEGWHVGPIEVTHHWDPLPGYPAVTLTVTFYWGTEIEGRVMRYSGKTGRQGAVRRISVRATGATESDLAAVAVLLPNVEVFGGLSWPIEFDVTAEVIP